MEKRVTIHNARSGKHGVFKVKHNDRTYQEEPRKTNNRYWHISKDKTMTFEQAEMDFYERHFSKSLAKQNAKYEKKRNYSRMKSMEDYYTNKRTCPEETLFYIGKMGNSAPGSDLWTIVQEQLAWEQKTFPQAKILDFALHTDEGGAPHIHSRKVWIAHDEDGNEIVSQEQALAEMGVQAPNPGKKVDRYNNAKQTYSKAVRDHFMALCKQHGYEIIEEPKEPGKSGLTHFQYILQDTQEQAEQILRNAKQEAREILKDANEKTQEIQRKEDFLDAHIKAVDDVYSILTEEQRKQTVVRETYDKFCNTTLSYHDKMIQEKEKIDKNRQDNTATWEDIMPPGI